MDEQELEKKFQELRAQIGDVEMAERHRLEQALDTSPAGHQMHWALKLAIFAAILAGSYLLYLLLIKLGLL